MVRSIAALGLGGALAWSLVACADPSEVGEAPVGGDVSPRALDSAGAAAPAASGTAAQVAAADAPLMVLPSLGPCEERAADARDAIVLASWNMRAARSAPLDEVAAFLAALEADVVLLQEVDVGVRRTDRVDQPAVLAERLGYEYAFAASIEYQGGDYGLAILSRLPFERVERLRLDAEGAYEPRIALDTTLCAGSRRLRVVDHHADLYPWVSRPNLEQVLEAVGESIGHGLVLGGDLNQDPEGELPTRLRAAGLADALLLRDVEAPTWNGRRLDYLFIDTALHADVMDARVVETTASDHHALTATLRLPSPAGP